MPQATSNYLNEAIPAPISKTSGLATPTRNDARKADAKRKQTLLSLLDVLNELKLMDDNPGGSFVILNHVSFSCL